MRDDVPGDARLIHYGFRLVLGVLPGDKSNLGEVDRVFGSVIDRPGQEIVVDGGVGLQWQESLARMLAIKRS
jgi:hypothetical protein